MMHEKSEGYGIHGKQKKVKPRTRGEKWELWDGVVVQVIRHVREGAVEVILPSGKSAVLFDSEFRLRLEPPTE